ncbi:MAG: hypothetical protein ACOZJX_12865 [Pseudomonadota bacterium]
MRLLALRPQRFFPTNRKEAAMDEVVTTRLAVRQSQAAALR